MVRSYHVGDIYPELIDDAEIPDHMEVEVFEEGQFRLLFHRHGVSDECLEQFHSPVPHQVRVRLVGMDGHKPRLLLMIAKAGALPWYASEFDPHNFELFFEDVKLGDYDSPVLFEIILIDSNTGEIRGNQLVRSPRAFGERLNKAIHVILNEPPLTDTEHVEILQVIRDNFNSIEQIAHKTAAIGFEA